MKTEKKEYSKECLYQKMRDDSRFKKGILQLFMWITVIGMEPARQLSSKDLSTMIHGQNRKIKCKSKVLVHSLIFDVFLKII